MNVNIKYIKDAGIPDKERLILSILKEDDIGYYIIFNTVFIGEKVSTDIKHTFWFSDKKVHAGDLVVLYTKKGDKSERLNKEWFDISFFSLGIRKNNMEWER